MRDLLLTSELPLFHGIVQEEINQYGVDFSIWMVFQNLSSNQFNTPYTAAYQPVSSLVVTLNQEDTPLNWISHVCPLSISFFCRTA